MENSHRVIKSINKMIEDLCNVTEYKSEHFNDCNWDCKTCSHREYCEDSDLYL
ncbi:hypothetical protein KHQ82_05310 [Mycoplasmatota bacterium]|nr:hypothetical protein KHQ82_05310 [Mycoplasmatota bacterium]